MTKEKGVADTVRLNKKFTLFKSSPIWIFHNIFWKFNMWVAMGLFYQMIQKDWRYCMLEWAGATFVKLTKIQAWQELVFVLAAISKIESRQKGSEIIILMVWWHFMKEYALFCVYSDICHQHFMLHRAVDYFIESFWILFGVFSNDWCDNQCCETPKSNQNAQ